MAVDSMNVAIAKPRGRASGAIRFGVVGTVTVPTDGVSELDENFLDPGYLTQDGVTNTVDQDWSDVIAFGGDRVLSVRTSRSESFSFGMIETNEASLKLTYGSQNVTLDPDSHAITVLHNATDSPELVTVAEFALRGNRVKRIVIPRGQVTDIDDVQYQDGSEDPVTYTPTVAAMPDEHGNTAYEYIVELTETPTGVRLTAPGGGTAPTTVQATKKISFAAAVSYADGTTSPIVDGVTLKSSDTDKATVAGMDVTGVAAGTADITASYAGVTSAPVTVTVTAAPAANK